MFIILVFIVLLIWSLWRFIHSIRSSKKVISIPYALIFLGFGTILVSMRYPGGFEGMGISICALPFAIIGLVWVLVQTIITKIKKV